jgi:demethylmenaquinone methyltransferase/2-methoxy-6-polyprenyl-1,4-benzoquinol methylase
MPEPAPAPSHPSGSLHPAKRIQAFFAAISGRYDLANHLLSAGCDFLWRIKAARTVAAWKPGRILDLACGSGDLARELARACPGTLIVGADFCAPMLQKARAKGVGCLVVADALQLPFAAASFDAATVAFGLRNMESWGGALRELARILRPGGHVLILDFSMPTPPLRWIYRPYLHRVLPLVAALVTRQRAVYQYLADSIEEFPSGPAMYKLLGENGFAEPQATPLQGGIVTIHTAVARTDGRLSEGE